MKLGFYYKIKKYIKYDRLAPAMRGGSVRHAAGGGKLEEVWRERSDSVHFVV